ncbi:MAG: efflux RND transporter periplasmic adaptor subunit, partial [Gemmatimonadales bacterium]
MFGDRGQRRSVGVSFIALASVLAGCRPASAGDASAEESRTANGTAGARVVNVEVATVAPEHFVDYVRITGEVEAYHDITVSAEESGRIAWFAVEKGTRVGRGQVIAKIDDAVLAAQVEEARALASVAREQYRRQQRLWQDDGIGSEIAVLQLESSSEAADARLAMMEERLRRTEIKAPVAGVFDEKYVEIGELVGPGTRIARVVAVDRVKVTGGVPERYALDIREGDSARITFDVLGGEEFVGTISFVGTSVDPSNRTIPVE